MAKVKVYLETMKVSKANSKISEGDISATTDHSIAVMRAVYSHPMPKERRGGTDDRDCARN